MALNIPEGFKTVKSSSTKPSKSSQRVLKHVWTLDWTGCSLEEMAGLAADSLIIRNQNLIRADATNGRPARFPEGAVSVRVTEVVRASRASVKQRRVALPPTMESIMASAKSDPDFAKRIVEMLAAMNPSEEDGK